MPVPDQERMLPLRRASLPGASSDRAASLVDREWIVANNPTPLIEYEKLGRDAMLSAPTPDHYLPLLYILGARRDDDNVTFPVEGVDGGSVSMLSVMFN